MVSSIVLCIENPDMLLTKTTPPIKAKNGMCMRIQAQFPAVNLIYCLNGHNDGNKINLSLLCRHLSVHYYDIDTHFPQQSRTL